MSVVSTCVNGFFEGKKIVFFGAGQFNLSAISLLRGLISYFVDNSPSKHSTMFYGIPVCSVNVLSSENRDNTLIIINTEYYQEIAKQVFDFGFRNIFSEMYKHANEAIPESEFRNENFLQKKAKALASYDLSDVRKLFSDTESKYLFDRLLEKYKSGNFDFSELMTSEQIYFNKIFKNYITDSEVFIDAGAFDGKTVVDFILYTNGRYKKIYAFEPDITNYRQLRRNISDCPNVSIYQHAISNSEIELIFDSRGTQSSKIVGKSESNSENCTKVMTLRVDDVVTEPPTFIKMDIEGGEIDAIAGASNVIKEYKPKLSISVYHKDDDLARIPLLLHELVPEYSFYLLHHTRANVDTVLYAMTGV